MAKEEKYIVFEILCMLLPYKPKVHVEHDVFYDSREAYYDGMELAYQDILEKLFKKKKL